MRAWHFTGDTLRDCRPVPAVGVKLVHNGKVIPCESGLHASRDPFDALQFAPGQHLHLVECGGEVVPHGNPEDKIACSERTIIASMDATPLLRYFARMQALSVTNLWEPPQVVLEYLMTGDESARGAARAAARAAARGAAWAAARDAARDAAWAAAWAAELDAARDAAWSAARDAAWAAARDAELDAARKDFNELVYSAFEDWL